MDYQLKKTEFLFLGFQMVPLVIHLGIKTCGEVV